MEDRSCPLTCSLEPSCLFWLQTQSGLTVALRVDVLPGRPFVHFDFIFHFVSKRAQTSDNFGMLGCSIFRLTDVAGEVEERWGGGHAARFLALHRFFVGLLSSGVRPA